MRPSLQPVATPLRPRPTHHLGPSGMGTDTAGGEGDAPIDFRRIFLTFWKWKWVFLLIFTAVAAAVAYKTMSAPKVYQASSTVQINPRTPQVLSEIREVVELGTGTYWANREFFTTQYAVIKSRLIAKLAVEREGLARDPDFLGLSKVVDPAELAKASAAADAPAVLMSRVAVTPVEGSHLANIAVEDFNPERARKLSIAVAHAYKDLNLEMKVRETKKALKLLQSQKDELRTKLENAEKALVDFKRTQGILTISLSDRQNVVTQDLLAFANALSKLESDRVRVNARLEQLKKKDDAALAVERERLETSSRSYGSLTETIDKLRREREDLLVRYLEQHPKVLALDKKLTKAEAALTAEKKRIREQARAKFEAELNEVKRSAGATERAYQEHKKLVNRTNARAQQYSTRELEFLRLSREVEETKRSYHLISKRHKEVDIAKEIHNNNVSVLDEAKGAALVRPRLFYSLMFALGLGFFAGLGAVVLLNFFDKTIKSQDDLERVLGLNFLGVVPTVKDEGGTKVPIPELYVHTHPKSTVAELVRTVRTNIQFMSPDHVPRKLVITSGQPLEGKTTVSLSLGISMAQAGHRVLLVSSDMRRPRIQQPFGFRGKKGISNWVVGEANLDDIILQTEVPNLFLLPCGPIPPNPAEILQSEKFHLLVEELEKRFERILFDSPPIGAVTDPLILSAHADGVILVGQAGVTTKDMMRHAIKKLRAVNANILGGILNNLDLTARGYGSHYYRQGYYYTSDEETPNV